MDGRLEQLALLEARLNADKKRCPIAYYEPRPSVVPFHADCEHTVRFVSGGKQSTKTYSNVAEDSMALTGIESIHCPGALKKFHPPPWHSRHWCEDLVKAGMGVLLPIYQKLLPPELLVKRPGQRIPGFFRDSWKLELTNGSTVQFMSYGMDPMKGESATLDGIIYDEPPPESLYVRQYMRILARGGLMWGGMTLDERVAVGRVRWIERRIRRQGDGPHVICYQASTLENVLAMAEERGGEEEVEKVQRRIDDAKRVMTEDDFSVNFLGGVYLRRLVYPEFRPEIHAAYDLASPEELVGLAQRGHGEIWCGLDYGMRDPTAVVWWYFNVTPEPSLELAEGDIIQFREYKRGNTKLHAHIAALKLLSRGEPIRGWAAAPDLWNEDSQGRATDAATMIEAGITPLMKGSKNKVAGLQTVAKLLEVPPKGSYPQWPRLRICKNKCPETVEEYLGYSVVPENERTGKGGDKTVDVNDHLMDASRYLAVGRPVTMRVRQPMPSPVDPMTGIPLSVFV